MPVNPATFRFRFERSYRAAARLFGVTPENALVTVGGDRLDVEFGRWHVDTPLDNIREVRVTGPYYRIKTAGPARLTFSDRGLTFATNHRRGVEIHFVEPVRGIEPTGQLAHPNLTVTVADCDALAEILRAAR